MTLIKTLLLGKGRLSRNGFICWHGGLQLIIWGIVYYYLKVNADILYLLLEDFRLTFEYSRLPWLLPVFSLLCYSCAMLQCQRWHDLNKGAWYLIFSLPPLLGWLGKSYLIAKESYAQDNIFGASPAESANESTYAPLILALYLLLAIFVTMAAAHYFLVVLPKLEAIHTPRVFT